MDPHGGMGSGSPQAAAMSALFWGDRAVVLFPGWPGARGTGAYLLCLLFVLVLAALAEALHPVSAYVAARRRRALLLTLVHAARMGTAYLVMLAVMSFNGGVLLAAVAGHALGFFLARSRAAAAVEAGHGAGAARAGHDLDLGGVRGVVPPSDDASIVFKA